MSAGIGPCRGELEFWAVMRAQMIEQTKQLKRIADALAASSGTPADRSIRVGDTVVWTDPKTGMVTGGWRVVTVPEYGTDGSYHDGVYYIELPDGTGAEVHLREIAVYRPALDEAGSGMNPLVSDRTGGHA